jgi:ribosomal-protein-alanine N-acetyltransferase
LFDYGREYKGDKCVAINNIGTQRIETDRLILRKFESIDAEDMIKNWISHPVVQNNYGEPIYTTTEEVSKVLENWISAYSNLEFYRWAIILKETNINIGQVAFYKVDSNNQNLDVEYCIGESYWGKGYATEALKAIMKYGFEKMHYNRIQAFHRRQNPSSGQVLIKSGMQYEGTLRQYLLHNDSFDDCIMYAALKEEYSY